MIRTLILCATSVFLAFVSRKSLVRPRSHGFPRFFAWESLAALFLRDELYPFDRTSRIVDFGLYRHVRHPLYASLLFLTWGLYLKLPAWPELLLAFSASAFLVLASLIDGIECLEHFGDAYRTYMKTTRRFIPFLV